MKTQRLQNMATTRAMYFQTHLSSFLSVISGLLKALKENSTKLQTTVWDLMAFHGRLVHRAECPLFS